MTPVMMWTDFIIFIEPTSDCIQSLANGSKIKIPEF